MVHQDIDYIDLKEFIDEGFLQEANRQFFHPLGLALEITFDEKGRYFLSGVWDYRDDSEGMEYGFRDIDSTGWDREEVIRKAETVEAEKQRHLDARSDWSDNGIEKLPAREVKFAGRTGRRTQGCDRTLWPRGPGWWINYERSHGVCSCTGPFRVY